MAGESRVQSRVQSRVALLLDTDLFFVAKVRATLAHAGYDTRTMRRAEDFAAALHREAPSVALVNTQARGIARADWVAAVQAARAAGVPVIAFGAHVDLETQAAARAAGATRVISNSKLASDLTGIVARVVAPVDGDDAGEGDDGTDDTEQGGR